MNALLIFLYLLFSWLVGSISGLFLEYDDDWPIAVLLGLIWPVTIVIAIIAGIMFEVFGLIDCIKRRMR